jgi:SH3-like domain-containing protein
MAIQITTPINNLFAEMDIKPPTTAENLNVPRFISLSAGNQNVKHPSKETSRTE